ncbi:MAG: hypothetical protein JJ920_08650 [Roseitalea sp.]|jgi:hypothetical protein|nr:hypothetical protein [Roseitalea sp.]MBO6722489.1 hypothetical protein [Roseitalea sp.]MBO6742967.1 hypothetical protein [Roseitalea sp.]
MVLRVLSVLFGTGLVLAPAMDARAADASFTINEIVLTRYAQALDLEGSGTASFTVLVACFNGRLPRGTTRVAPSAGGLVGLGQLSRQPTLELEAERTLVLEAERVRPIQLARCPQQQSVTYSWRVQSIEAQVSPSGVRFSGFIAMEAMNNRAVLPFSVDATVSYSAASRTLRLRADNTPVALRMHLLGAPRTLGNVRFRNRLSTGMVLEGLLARPGPDISISGTNVSVQLQQNAIRVRGDLAF